MNKHLPLALAASMLLLFSLSGCKDSHKTNKSSKQEMEDSLIIDSVINVQNTLTTEANSTRVISIDDLSEPSGYINGHGYVDLGLSVKWATCNVGANSPSDYGNYYAWGETCVKSEYTRDNNVTWGKKMSSIAGDPKYDAARANWGGSWRLPTESEIDELTNLCRPKWDTQGGHKGFKITGPNGNSIFLPTAGWRYGTWLNDDGDYGIYWSATPLKNDTEDSYCLYFGLGYYGGDWDGRYGGQSIRPVSE